MKDYRDANLQKVAEYIQQGCKAPSESSIGIEMEHFVVDKATGKTVDYYGEHGVEYILEQLSPLYLQKGYAQGHLIALQKEGWIISIEPAAQLEISIVPTRTIHTMERYYEAFRREIDPVLEELGYELVERGYQPESCVDELNLIPKKRYQLMQSYFDRIGKYGRYMMKGTASTQVSIDYFDEADCAKKYQLAVELAPLLSRITENVTMFEGKKNTTPLLRHVIWEGVDKARTRCLHMEQNENDIFRQYATYVMNVPLVVGVTARGEEKETEETANDFYAQRLITEPEIEHVLSMVFPEVRLKHYIEIRYADSLPLSKALAYAALLKGIFGDTKSLGEMRDKWDVWTLLALAERNLEAEDRHYLEEWKEGR